MVDGRSPNANRGGGGVVRGRGRARIGGGCYACEKIGTVRVSPSVFCCNLLLFLCSNVIAAALYESSAN